MPTYDYIVLVYLSSHIDDVKKMKLTNNISTSADDEGKFTVMLCYAICT
jgi:hypothetical protein